MNKKRLSITLLSLVLLVSMLLAAATDAVVATPNCGTDPVVLNAYFETGFDLPFKLAE